MVSEWRIFSSCLGFLLRWLVHTVTDHLGQSSSNIVEIWNLMTRWWRKKVKGLQNKPENKMFAHPVNVTFHVINWENFRRLEYFKIKLSRTGQTRRGPTPTITTTARECDLWSDMSLLAFFITDRLDLNSAASTSYWLILHSKTTYLSM